jgi:hypothetical protein
MTPTYPPLGSLRPTGRRGKYRLPHRRFFSGGLGLALGALEDLGTKVHAGLLTKIPGLPLFQTSQNEPKLLNTSPTQI